MKAKQIKQIIADYENLIKLAEYKFQILEEVDGERYNTLKGIIGVAFELNSNTGDQVIVDCDDSCCGCYDSEVFHFPLSYLSLDDDELRKVVLLAKEEREEKKKKEEQEKFAKEEEAKKEFELAELERLKAKYHEKEK